MYVFQSLEHTDKLSTCSHWVFLIGGSLHCAADVFTGRLADDRLRHVLLQFNQQDHFQQPLRAEAKPAVNLCVCVCENLWDWW